MWSKLNSKTRQWCLIAFLVIIILITLQYMISGANHWNRPSYNSADKTRFKGTKGVLISTQHGLGNQLFFYAAGYALSRNINVTLWLPEPLSLRNSSFIERNNSKKREYLLDQLLLPSANVISYDKVKKDHKLRHASCAEVATSPETKEPVTYFMMDAYCFNEEYFQAYSKELKQIKVMVKDPTDSYKKWKELIAQEEFPVAVHVRRGDLVKENYMTTPIEYFKTAMEKMKKLVRSGVNTTFFVFSDEMNFAKVGLSSENFIQSLGLPVHFVSGSFGGMTNLEEFDLMIKCRSIVISNSSFSWWAAYLMKDSTDKVVIRPSLKKTEKYSKDMSYRKEYVIRYPKEWLYIESNYN